MSANEGLELWVGDSVSGYDTAKGRCRLHRATMAELGLSSGEPVTITIGQGTVAAYVYPAEHGEWGLRNARKDTVYIGIDTFLGEDESEVSAQEAIVRPASPAPAERVVCEALPPGTASELDALLSENVVGALAVAGTPMTVYEERGTAVQALQPTVYETVPDEVVVVTEDTDLQVDAR